MFELIEEALNEIAFAVEREIARPSRLAVGFWWDHCSDSAPSQSVEECIGIVPLVADQGIGIGVVDQQLSANKVMSLAWGEHQLDGIAQGIDERVNLGGQSAARPADCLRTVFFRAPAEC